MQQRTPNSSNNLRPQLERAWHTQITDVICTVHMWRYLAQMKGNTRVQA